MSSCLCVTIDSYVFEFVQSVNVSTFSRVFLCYELFV
jgi:hypothetical protein